VLEELGAAVLRAHVGERQDRRAPGAVEEVRRQDGVAALGDPVGHLLDAPAQAEGVHHEQHAGVAFLVGAGQVGIGDAVGRPDLES
jgi:hypothetical protein